jgi:hypothetical protein
VIFAKVLEELHDGQTFGGFQPVLPECFQAIERLKRRITDLDPDAAC